MPEEMSLGEIGRNFMRLDKSLNELRQATVPLTLWDAEHRALIDRLREHEKAAAESLRRVERDIEELRRDHERDLKELRRSVNERFEKQRQNSMKSREFSWTRGTSIAVALATIIGVIVAAYAASRGVH